MQQIDHSSGCPLTMIDTNDIQGLAQVLVADDGTEQAHSLFGLDLIGQDEGANVRHLLADGLGSVRTEMVGGNVEAVTTYGPYGTLLAQTGAANLLYLRARYYNPNLHVFMSRDRWQGNRRLPATLHDYSYGHNNPVKYSDPSGHCAGNENSVGNTFEENLCWAKVHTIENLWNDTDYWDKRWGSLDNFMNNIASHELLTEEFYINELMQYHESSEYKEWEAQLPVNSPPPSLDTGDYTVFSVSGLPFYCSFVGGKLIVDDYGNTYINIHFASMPGASLMRGYVYVNDGDLLTGNRVPLNELAVSEQEAMIQNILSGWSGGLGGGAYGLGVGINASMGDQAHTTIEGGLYQPGIAADIGRTFVVYDRTTQTLFPEWFSWFQN